MFPFFSMVQSTCLIISCIYIFFLMYRLSRIFRVFAHSFGWQILPCGMAQRRAPHPQVPHVPPGARWSHPHWHLERAHGGFHLKIYQLFWESHSITTYIYNHNILYVYNDIIMIIHYIIIIIIIWVDMSSRIYNGFIASDPLWILSEHLHQWPHRRSGRASAGHRTVPGRRFPAVAPRCPRWCRRPAPRSSAASRPGSRPKDGPRQSSQQLCPSHRRFCRGNIWKWAWGFKIFKDFEVSYGFLSNWSKSIGFVKFSEAMVVTRYFPTV